MAEEWIKRHVEPTASVPSTRSSGTSSTMNKAWVGRDFSRSGAAMSPSSLTRSRISTDLVRPTTPWQSYSRHGQLVRHAATRTTCPPWFKGMTPHRPEGTRKHARILDDDEIRAVWKLARQRHIRSVSCGRSLTAQRLEKVAAHALAGVSVDGVWTIPAEEREKGNAGGALVLPEIAIDIIRAQPHFVATRSCLLAEAMVTSIACRHANAPSTQARVADRALGAP